VYDTFYSQHVTRAADQHQNNIRAGGRGSRQKQKTRVRSALFFEKTPLLLLLLLLLCLPPLSRQVRRQGSCILRVPLPTQLRGGGLPRRSQKKNAAARVSIVEPAPIVQAAPDRSSGPILHQIVDRK
jgi:hypothetical protein